MWSWKLILGFKEGIFIFWDLDENYDCSSGGSFENVIVLVSFGLAF